MSIISLTTQHNVAVLTLTNGENRQNPQFAHQLKQALAEVVENLTAFSYASDRCH
ncbi:hypothetical protein [Pseudoalteromonas arctica]|uniref:hypothetical protein n=1 Tax=Pseudoalteromonas arctica TaxID=394751 RepID=UPI0020071007|nr:hypothetical protein [Pseudoalteromonas arctica]